ncbi:MAG: DUF4159 domain-containing protein [Hyphomicrobiales bacterium]|nr:DUF4159 domain-containing protein [Hyphomicrobiales bacterium]
MGSTSFLGLPLGFAFPWALLALLLLPVLWWLLRLTPPRPTREPFPPTRILAHLIAREETPARSPWWLTLLRLLMAALAIVAMAAPVWNPGAAKLSGNGPLLMVLDNDWASGTDWEERLISANAIINEAEAADREIIVLSTANDARQKIEIASPDALRVILASWTNQPVRPDYVLSAQKVAEANQKYSPSSIVFLSSGVEQKGIIRLAEELQVKASQKILFLPDTQNTIVINSVDNQPGAMVGEMVRANSKGSKTVSITGLDIKGISIARQQIVFDDGEKTANFQFEIPVELRNDIVRIVIDGIQNAGAVKLLDESNRRRLVGLISGEKHNNAQPLLSPLYYISKALEPFSDIRRANNANIDIAIPELITNGVSTIILADIGVLPSEASQKIRQWAENGGMLIRFAGPRLAAAPNNDLLPVRIRRGDRNIGGALSWEKPKPVAEFEIGSPFFGLEPPQEVFVSRQVLALQETNLAKKTWARLSDGTPLVTAEKIGAGWTVLFHISSDASWSNLPISGTFVEMLRRVVNQSRSSLSLTNKAQSRSLPPLRLLNGKGRMTAPDINTKPLNLKNGVMPVVSLANPPGIYGTQDGFRALNLFNSDADLKLLGRDILGNDTIVTRYAGQRPLLLAPWALLLLALLLILDCVSVLWMAGQFRYLKLRLPGGNSTRHAAFLAGLVLVFSIITDSPPTLAQENSNTSNTIPVEELSKDFDFTPSLRTRLAYVITGISLVDETSEAGLLGLTKYLTERTAIEPGEPIGVDIAKDELAFYPIIYWPVHTSSGLPDAQTMARIDAYMKKGGSILFDTRDQISGFSGGTSLSPEATMLQAILINLDIPPLEPVPEDHVLTKSFFILSQFPGRYTGGDLWVEQLPDEQQSEKRPVRVGDGVSSIMITSNDLAGAWAIDRQSRPIYPIVPPNPIQREIAFRVGVNLIMYAMTGNYKSDQVHIPALLERLGQ